MRTSRTVGAVVIGLVCCGCAEPATQLPTPVESRLLLSDRSDDALTRELVVRQRAMFALILSNDRSGLADYLDVRFTWRSPTEPSVGIGGRIGGRHMIGAHSGYYAILAGTAPLDIAAQPTEFRVTVFGAGNGAMVAAGSPGSLMVYQTYWRSTPDGWRATFTDQHWVRLPTPAERALLDSMLSQQSPSSQRTIKLH